MDSAGAAAQPATAPGPAAPPRAAGSCCILCLFVCFKAGYVSIVVCDSGHHCTITVL